VLDAGSHRLAPLVATSSGEAILSWSHDGEWIAYAQWEGSEQEPERLRLVASHVDGSQPREVVCCGDFPTNFHWSPDSRQLIFPAFDGTQLHLSRVDIEREQPFDAAQLPDSLTSLYPSPDGTRYVMALNVEGQSDIFVIHADGSGLTNLTDHPANDDSPIWSLDGRYIAFASNRGDSGWLRQLYIMRADGRDVRLVGDKCVGPFFWHPQPTSP
jgi:TolB protein